jgi:hypothetical protein
LGADLVNKSGVFRLHQTTDKRDVCFQSNNITLEANSKKIHFVSPAEGGGNKKGFCRLFVAGVIVSGGR